MVDPNETNDILIKITHYINPQLFWYTNVKKLQKTANQLKQLEFDIWEHYKTNPFSKQHYKVDDMIILHYLPMKKFIRGKVLHIEKRYPIVYIVWAIDYGFPIETKSEHMFSLPEQFHKLLGHIAFGGVGYIVLDDILLRSNENSRFESILMKAKSLHFAKMFQSSTGQDFGYLFIYEESRSFNALEHLINNKLGTLATSDFNRICTQLEATKNCSWRSMSDNTKLSLAIKNSSNVEDLKCKIINDIVTKSTSISTGVIMQTPLAPPVNSVKTKVDLVVPIKSNQSAPQMLKENSPKQADKLADNKNIISTCSERSLRINYMDHLVVAHAQAAIEPIDHFNNANFECNVWRIMTQNKFNKLYRLQRIAWPYLLRGNRSLILINQPKSGRTWSYLPVLCSDVEKQYKKDLKMNRSHIFGPMAIVLVADVKKAQYVATACDMLLSNISSFKGNVVAAYAGQDRASVSIQIHNGCGILVTTPPQLKELFKHNVTENMFNPSKLLYLVIDDLDLICIHYGTLFKALFNDLLKVSNFNKSNHLKPQLVLTSQHWDSNVMNFCIKYAQEPLLLFGDFLEAAAYAQVPLRMKIVDINNKFQNVIDFLDKRVCNGRTIIYCTDDSSILMLQRQLEKEKFECLSYLKTSGAVDQEKIRAWQCHPTNKILICADDSPELKTVQNAKYLIHYTLADSWSKFTFRFSSIAENFRNAVIGDIADDSLKVKEMQAKPVALVLLEEGDTRWIMRLKNFMEKHNIEIPEFLTSLSKDNLRKSEHKRTMKGWALCPMLATYGDCLEYGCSYRHLLTIDDTVPADQRDLIPVDGVIAMQVLKIYSPAHLAVMILKHQDPQSHKWRKLPNDENSIALGFELNMHFADESKRQIHWPPMVHDICIIKVGGQYRRVRIMNVGDLQHTHIVQPDISVTLRVMDNNSDVLYRRAGQLFHCPLQFQTLPAMAIAVRVLGLVPFDGERNWSPTATNLVSSDLQSLNKDKNEQLLGLIDFTLAHTIFLQNIVKVEYLSAIKVHTNRFNLQKFLFKKELGKNDDAAVSKLRKIFTDINTTSDMQSLNNSNDGEKCSVNENPKEQTSCENSIEMPQIPKKMTSSKSIEHIEEIEIKMKSLSKSNSEESWCTLSINELTQIEILNEQDNGNWDGFYIIVMNPEHLREFNDILKQAKDYIIEKQPEHLTSMRHCKPGDNFIIEDGNNFLRAKLIAEYESSNLDCLYRFLLVDSGYFIFLSASALKRSRKIYKSTNEIACSIPYQTIYCKLAGIVLRPNQKIVKVTAKHLYVVAKRQFKSPLRDMKMHSYEVILFECDNEDDLTSGIMLNKHLINLDVAYYDDKTKTDLDIELKPIRDSVTQLQQCLMNMEDYEIDTTKNFVKHLLGDDEIQSPSKPDKREDEIKSNTIIADSKDSKQLSPDSQVIKSMLPATTYPTKCPQLTWFQNSGFINISIEASEVTDYLVFCNSSQLFYATMPPNESPAQLLNINLCGYVEQVAHEKLGLYVNIKLRKKMCGLWPSLVEASEDDLYFKLPFIKYNLDHLKIDSEELSHVQLTQLALNRIEAGLHQTPPKELEKINANDNNCVDAGADDGPERDLKEYRWEP